MTTTQDLTLVRVDVSRRIVGLVLVLTLAVVASEALLFHGHVWYAISAYSLLIVAISLAPLFLKADVAVVQAFALLPVFRLVNVSMPLFFERTLFWLVFVYAPFIPVVAYLGRQTAATERPVDQQGSAATVSDRQKPGEWSNEKRGTIRHDLPWWLGGTRGKKLRPLFERVWRIIRIPDEAPFVRSLLYRAARALLVLLLALAVVVFLVLLGVVAAYLAEVEYGMITPAPLIPALTSYHITILAVVMIVFVGFVEELLFRGILQQVLERQLGRVPGLLLASGLFGLMYSAYGLPMELVFAAGLGLLFGVIYDATDSLVLISCMHGMMNVLVFGVIPLDGPSFIDVLPTIIP